jgi:hypothetical protein
MFKWEHVQNQAIKSPSISALATSRRQAIVKI